MAEGSIGSGEKLGRRDTEEVGMGRVGGPNAGRMVWRTATEGGRGERALDGGEITETPLPPSKHHGKAGRIKKN
jgi:hypothetical protein